MNKWSFIDKTYLYDGSFEGFLSTIDEVFSTKEIPHQITTLDNYVPDIFRNTVNIAVKDSNSEFIKSLIQNDKIYYPIYLAFFSSNLEKEMIILKYIIYYDRYKNDLPNMKHLEVVINLNKITKQVTYECHKFKGFLRFTELTNQVLYAEFEPKNDIITLLVSHFQDRLPNEYFIINDILRNKAIFCHKNEMRIVDSTNINRSSIVKSLNENIYSNMWKGFFNKIGIENRTNRKCQMTFMPKRFWKHLTEMEQEDE